MLRARLTGSDLDTRAKREVVRLCGEALVNPLHSQVEWLADNVLYMMLLPYADPPGSFQ